MGGEMVLGFIVVIFIIVVNISKAKKRQKSAQEAASALNVSQKTRDAYQKAQNTAPQAQQEAPRTFAPFRTADDAEGRDPCHEEQLSGMPPHAGEEGFDPCHKAPSFSMELFTPAETDADREENARELLRGVVLSEILGRRQLLRR